MALSTWPIPKQYADTTLWASGNQTTCNVQGVFTQGATIMSVLYYGTLATYVLLVVRFGVRERSIERFEWYFHVIPIIFGAGTGIATVPLQLTNNANLWCFIAPSSDPDRLLSPDEANTYRMVFFYGPLFVVTLFLTVNMIVVAMFVRRLTTKAILASTYNTMNGDGSCGSNSAATNRSFFWWRRRQRLPRILERGIGIGSDDDDDDDDSIDGDDEDHDDEDPEVKGRANFSSAEFSFDSTIGDSSGRSNRYAIWRRKIFRQNLCFTLAFYFTWTPISVSYACLKVVKTSRTLQDDIVALLTVLTLRSHFSSSLSVPFFF